MRPLQGIGTFLRFVGCLRAISRAAHDVVEEYELSETESTCAYGRNHIEVCELQGIVGDTARHACETKEMLYKESHVEKYH